VHEACNLDDDPLCLDELCIDDLDTHTSLVEQVESSCEDAYLNNEPLFLDELFKDECDNSGEKTCVENFESRVPFQKRKLDLSIFTFENMIQESLLDQSFENLFEDELICLDESLKDSLVSYTPPKKIIDPNFEVMFEDELKFLGTHIVDTLIMLCDNDEFVRGCGKKIKRRWRKVMNKLEDEIKGDKKINPFNLSLEKEKNL